MELKNKFTEILTEKKALVASFLAMQTKVLVCEIDGKEYNYNCASTERDSYPQFEEFYIGLGTIKYVDGVLQSNTGKKLHFWNVRNV